MIQSDLDATVRKSDYMSLIQIESHIELHSLIMQNKRNGTLNKSNCIQQSHIILPKLISSHEITVSSLVNLTNLILEHQILLNFIRRPHLRYRINYVSDLFHVR